MSDPIKEKVIAELSRGRMSTAQIDELARRYNVPVSQVMAWKKEIQGTRALSSSSESGIERGKQPLGLYVLVLAALLIGVVWYSTQDRQPSTPPPQAIDQPAPSTLSEYLSEAGVEEGQETEARLNLFGQAFDDNGDYKTYDLEKADWDGFVEAVDSLVDRLNKAKGTTNNTIQKAVIEKFEGDRDRLILVGNYIRLLKHADDLLQEAGLQKKIAVLLEYFRDAGAYNDCTVDNLYTALGGYLAKPVSDCAMDQCGSETEACLDGLTNRIKTVTDILKHIAPEKAGMSTGS